MISPGKLAVRRPVAVVMRIAALVLLGVVCLTRLPVDLLPKVALPTVVVNTSWPNVAPEEIETQVTRPIEQAVSSASGINVVTSTSSPGSSSVRVQFNYGVDVGRAAVDVLQLVERSRQRLPNDPTLQSPVVYRLDPSQLPILIFGVSGESDPAKLKSLLVNQVSPIIQSADGVASAVVTGGADRAIVVDIDPVRLRARGLTLADISRRLVQENLNLPAGIARTGDTEYTIRSLGYLKSVAEIQALPVGRGDGQAIRLDEVANVRDSMQEVRLRTRLDGEGAVGMIVVKQSEANTVATADAVKAKVEEVQRLYPQLRFGLAYDQSQFVVHSVDDVKISAFIGGALAIVILLGFLRNFRSTLVVALSIPISIFSTFTLFWLCGFTLNTLTLSGLSLATGLIVDDAVVVLENIFRHIERDGKDPVQASIEGTDEITSAVVSSTITIMVVFLPLFLVKGQSGQLFSQFALVVIFSIAVSLLDALTVVPMLASRLIRPSRVGADRARKRSVVDRLSDRLGEGFDALDRSYRDVLTWALRRRFLVVAAGFGISYAGTALLPYIGTEVLPATDSGNFNVNVRHPVGTAFTVTDETVRRAEAVVRADPDVETVFAASGTTLNLRGTTTGTSSHQGSLTVRLKEDRKRTTQQVIQDVQKRLSKELVGARATATPFDLVAQIISGGNQNVEIDLFGSDLEQLVEVSRGVLEQIREIPGMENADTNLQDATPELRFVVDRDKAQRLGVSFADIAQAVGTATNGTLSSWYQEGGFQYPILVQVPEALRKDPTKILDLPVGTGVGENASTVTLGQVARPVVEKGPNEITRQNSQRYIAITAVAQGRPQSELLADIRVAMEKIDLPDGVFWTFGRQQQQREQDFAGLGLAVGLAIALVYMLLASQFESFHHPLTILATVPLSALGVILALFLTGRSFGLTAYIGILLLVGIVVKNGILLIEYTNQLRERGMERNEAVLTASPTRLRPILMTTGAAVLGMVPLAMAWARGTEIQAPLATAVIGGLLTSTVLTLVVVPVMYTLLDDLAGWLRGRR
jgi:HAE1 family hydrophobic/amphiphilic exporter-1